MGFHSTSASFCSVASSSSCDGNQSSLRSSPSEYSVSNDWNFDYGEYNDNYNPGYRYLPQQSSNMRNSRRSSSGSTTDSIFVHSVWPSEERYSSATVAAAADGSKQLGIEQTLKSISDVDYRQFQAKGASTLRPLKLPPRLACAAVNSSTRQSNNYNDDTTDLSTTNTITRSRSLLGDVYRGVRKMNMAIMGGSSCCRMAWNINQSCSSSSSVEYDDPFQRALMVCMNQDVYEKESGNSNYAIDKGGRCRHHFSDRTRPNDSPPPLSHYNIYSRHPRRLMISANVISVNQPISLHLNHCIPRRSCQNDQNAAPQNYVTTSDERLGLEFQVGSQQHVQQQHRRHRRGSRLIPPAAADISCGYSPIKLFAFTKTFSKLKAFPFLDY